MTILDVAALAGVHAGTVSRALNRPEQVAEETRVRVEAAAEELGFVPNRAARGLITGRTGNIAVIVPDITNPFFALLVRSIERTAREADQQVLLVDTGERNEEEERAARTLGPEVDGLIVVSPRKLHRVVDVGSTPVVFVNRPAKGRASVVMRSAAAAADALRHLADLGHSRVVHVEWIRRARGPRPSGAMRCCGRAGPAGSTSRPSRPTHRPSTVRRPPSMSCSTAARRR